MALAWLFLVAAGSLPAAANESWRVAFDIENDVLVAEDRHYTNGLALSVVAPRTFVPRWIATAAIVLPPYDTDPADVRWGFGIGHQMYTPENSALEALIPNDRPYAGFLHARFALYRDRNRDAVEKVPFLDTLEIDLGVVGPAAIAKEGQYLIHQVFPSPIFEGWDHQISNEAGLVVRRARHWRLPREPIEVGRGLGVDMVASLAAELGNVKTAATAGVLLRGGFRLPADFGRGRFSPAEPVANGFRLFAFAGAEVSAVVRDIFLDGNTFRDSHEVDKRTLVIHAPMGLAFERGRFRSSLAVVWNSEEFEGQDGADVYGRWSISLDY